MNQRRSWSPCTGHATAHPGSSISAHPSCLSAAATVDHARQEIFGNNGHLLPVIPARAGYTPGPLVYTAFDPLPRKPVSTEALRRHRLPRQHQCGTCAGEEVAANILSGKINQSPILQIPYPMSAKEIRRRAPAAWLPHCWSEMVANPSGYHWHTPTKWNATAASEEQPALDAGCGSGLFSHAGYISVGRGRR